MRNLFFLSCIDLDLKFLSLYCRKRIAEISQNFKKSFKATYVLLFRKSEILNFKVSITKHAAYFFDFQHLFDEEFHETSQNFSSFGQLLLNLGQVATQVTNQEVLLLANIW